MEFSQIALLFGVVAFLGIIAKLFKQPPLVGYLLAGLALSVFGLVGDIEISGGLVKVGLALLLFLVGLEMNFGEMKSLGRVSLLAGLGQIVFTSLIGFFLAMVLGFGVLPSIYIALALAFSSMIIAVKLLGAKNSFPSLWGKIVVGFLLVQNVVMMVILMFLSSLGTASQSGIGYLGLIAKVIALFGLVWVFSKRILPSLFERFVAGSDELLSVILLAWVLGMTAFVAGPLGFPLEIGGFLAGLSLSNLSEDLAVTRRTRLLKDFLMAFFFAVLGTQLAVDGVGEIVVPALIFSTLVLVGNPVMVMAMMGAMGYKKRTSFLAGLTVAQISEFSLILMATGLVLGHVSSTHLTLVVLVAVITMVVSTYLVMGADKVYQMFKGTLSVFERTSPREVVLARPGQIRDHVVLIGCDRAGRKLLPYLAKKGSVLVVDFNPTVSARLTADGVPVVFGDANDLRVLDMAQLDKAQLVVSTTSSLAQNLSLLALIKRMRGKPQIVMTALTKEDAVRLYEAGATCVVVPEIMAGEYLKHLFKNYGLGGVRIKKFGQSHFNRLIAKV